MTNAELVREMVGKRDALNMAIAALGEDESTPKSYGAATRAATGRNDPSKSSERSQRMRDAWKKRRERDAAQSAPEEAVAIEEVTPSVEAQEAVAEIPVEQIPVTTKTKGATKKATN